MLKFGLEIALGMIQKSGLAIFEILIFRDFSGGQSPKFCQNEENLIYLAALQLQKIIVALFSKFE